MKNLTITAAEFSDQSKIYLDAVLEGTFICVEKDGRHVCLLSDDYWRLIVDALRKLMVMPIK